MKTILKIAVIAIALVLMLIADIPLLSVSLVPEAEAIFDVRRRGVIVGATMGEASAASAKSQQQAATAQKPAAPAAAPTPPPGASGKPLPLGTVVSALPAGCSSTPGGRRTIVHGKAFIALCQMLNYLYAV